jgi:EAL domain-containing protein (putative c-di-GMP-specific phosphodiesterase class I)
LRRRDHRRLATLLDKAQMPIDAGDSSLVTVRNQRDRFVGFAFAAADLLIEVTRAGTIAFAAGAAQNLNGCSSENLVGTAFIDLVAPGDRAVVRALVAALDRSGRLMPVVIRLARDGSPPMTLGGCRLPNTKTSIFLSLSVATLPRTSQATLGADLLSREDFAGHASRRMLDDSTGDYTLTLVALDELEALQGRLAADVAEGLTKTVERYLQGAAPDIEAAGQLGADRYGLLHKSKLDTARLQQAVETISRGVDPTGQGVTMRSATMELDGRGLSGADAARALVYCINQFADSEAGDFSVPTLRDGLDKALASAVTRISDLRTTMTDGAFDLVFQPIVELRSRSVHHLEALTRFRTGDSPGSAFAFAEAVRMIADFDLAVCQRVVAMIGERPENTVPIAVNLSGRSLESSIFFAALLALCRSRRDLARHMLFELTESAVITRVDEVNRRLQALRAAGFKICLDDFGAGANSFHYLRSFEVDFVKIDGAFGVAASGNPRDARLLRSIAEFCREIGIATIAENVESEAQAAHFESLGLTHGQGYHFGRPLALPPAAALDRAVAKPQAARPNVKRRGVVTTWG